MSIVKHGLSIGIERVDSDFFLLLRAVGKLNHNDYEKTIPVLEFALKGVKDPKIKVLVDGTEFQGWERKAAWDNFKLGLNHGNEFDKIAIYGNKKWQHITSQIGSWFISGEIKYFEKYDDAIEWLKK